jgi:hypothetical protein
MKKTLVAIAILFSMSTKAQDTTYYQKRAQLYMVVKTPVTDEGVYHKYYSLQKRRYARNNRILGGVMIAFWTGVSIWFWSK